MKSLLVRDILLTLLMLTVCGSVAAEDRIIENGKEVREITVTRINPEAPRIDGNLDDEVWMSHEFDFAKDFIQLSPDEGEAPTESTIVAVCYDEHALYVAFWCYDSEPGKIVQQRLSAEDHSALINDAVAKFSKLEPGQN